MEDVAIVGAGICGLSTAYTLAEQGLKVRLIAKSFPPDTTSDRAAAFWFPYHIKSDQRCIRWSRNSYDKYVGFMTDKHTGISMHPLLKVTKVSTAEPNSVWQSFMPEGACEKIPKTALRGDFDTGFVVHVPLVETHIFLPWLMARLQSMGVELIKQQVKSLDEFTGGHKWVVNCTGLGARELCQDDSLYPVRGQVALTAPQQDLPIFLYEEQPFYIVPRRDATIIGGTYEEHVWDTTTEAATLQRLYTQAAELYPQLKQVPLTGGWAGLRPYRPEVRVEKETGKNIIHNYGHGGSGFTLAWGCAIDVLNLLGA